MKLEYYGHSFWRIVTDKLKVVIDPFDDIGYPIPTNLEADYIFVSHEHHDHNNTLIIKGNPSIVRIPGKHDFPNLKSHLISVYHDDIHGAKRGINNIIKLETDNLRLVHCGDLGHIPGSEVLQNILHPDILLVPVGGVYTLPVSDVWHFIDKIKPRLIFPMHYQTPVLKFSLGSMDDFLKDRSDIVFHDSNTLDITEELLSVNKVIVLNWAGTAK